MQPAVGGAGWPGPAHTATTCSGVTALAGACIVLLSWPLLQRVPATWGTAAPSAAAGMCARQEGVKEGAAADSRDTPPAVLPYESSMLLPLLLHAAPGTDSEAMGRTACPPGRPAEVVGTS